MVSSVGGMSAEAQEKLWLEQARRGDRAAFSRLVEAYQRPVYNLAYRMLGDAAEAEDATQETFVRVYTRLHTYEPGRKPASWVLAIASHHCIDRLRRRRLVWLSLDEDPVAAALPSRRPGPEEVALQREAHAEVQAAVMQLAPAYRLPLILRYWHDLSYEEIADTLGLTVQAVKSRLHRARQQVAAQTPIGAAVPAVAPM
jgi:RNA polymerase sigma-70 factor (ECF subfamily)